MAERARKGCAAVQREHGGIPQGRQGAVRKSPTGAYTSCLHMLFFFTVCLYSLFIQFVYTCYFFTVCLYILFIHVIFYSSFIHFVYICYFLQFVYTFCLYLLFLRLFIHFVSLKPTHRYENKLAYDKVWQDFARMRHGQQQIELIVGQIKVRSALVIFM